MLLLIYSIYVLVAGKLQVSKHFGLKGTAARVGGALCFLFALGFFSIFTPPLHALAMALGLSPEAVPVVSIVAQFLLLLATLSVLVAVFGNAYSRAATAGEPETKVPLISVGFLFALLYVPLYILAFITGMGLIQSFSYSGDGKAKILITQTLLFSASLAGAHFIRRFAKRRTARMKQSQAHSPLSPVTVAQHASSSLPLADEPSGPVATPAHPPAPARDLSATPGLSALIAVLRDHHTRLTFVDEDPSFKAAVSQLRDAGPAGSEAVAALIRELTAARCIELKDALVACALLHPHPELARSLEAVLSAPGLTTAPRTARFPPVIAGGGRIGWDDDAGDKMRRLASMALKDLAAEP